jgi:hypothetical protein
LVAIGPPPPPFSAVMLVISSLPQRLEYDAVDLPLQFSEFYVEQGGGFRERTG